MENERQQMTADTNRMKAEQHDLMEKIKDLEQNLTLLTQVCSLSKYNERFQTDLIVIFLLLLIQFD